MLHFKHEIQPTILHPVAQQPNPIERASTCFLDIILIERLRNPSIWAYHSQPCKNGSKVMTRTPSRSVLSPPIPPFKSFTGLDKKGSVPSELPWEKPTSILPGLSRRRPRRMVDARDYREMLDYAEWFREKNVIIVPHGSLVEYLGANNFRNLEVPTFGNRNILHWESSRALQRQWLEDGGCTMPKVVEDPHNIDGPVIVKYAGAKGGRGYFVARDYRDFRRNVDIEEEFTIQEYVLGADTTFISSLTPPPMMDSKSKGGRPCWQESRPIGIAFMDRRDESNVDEFYKLGSLRDLRKCRSNRPLW